MKDVFKRGEENPFGKYFKGKSYLNMLSTSPLSIGNVTFEPSCRNNWHIHHANKGGGQMLLVTGGDGWYQEWGKEARSLKEGDVVIIEPGVKHWHGAKKDKWFSHLSIEVPGENTSTQWLEEVSDSEYLKLED